MSEDMEIIVAVAVGVVFVLLVLGLIVRSIFRKRGPRDDMVGGPHSGRPL